MTLQSILVKRYLKTDAPESSYFPSVRNKVLKKYPPIWSLFAFDGSIVFGGVEAASPIERRAKKQFWA